MSIADLVLLPSDLKALKQALTDDRPEVRRKAEAILLRNDGVTLAEVARLVGVRSLTSIYNWMEAYRSGGIDGLANRQSSGRPRRATPAYQEMLEVITATNPRDAGVDLDAWTAEALNSFLQDLTGIAISDNRFRELLHDLGYQFTLVRTLPPGTYAPTTDAVVEAMVEAMIRESAGKKRYAWQKIHPKT